MAFHCLEHSFLFLVVVMECRSGSSCVLLQQPLIKTEKTGDKRLIKIGMIHRRLSSDRFQWEDTIREMHNNEMRLNNLIISTFLY